MIFAALGTAGRPVVAAHSVLKPVRTYKRKLISTEIQGIRPLRKRKASPEVKWQKEQCTYLVEGKGDNQKTEDSVEVVLKGTLLVDGE